MIKPICRDTLLLSRPSQAASAADLQVAQDLLDTLRANTDICVGMAANMIGINRRIIAISVGFAYLVMLNPEILSHSGPYEAEESCLSLPGQRKTTRYETIQVKYQDEKMVWHTQTFTGFPAQIIQHEVDHCNGILI